MIVYPRNHVCLLADCKGNPNSMREQLSLKTSQGKSKVNI
jgi:hypothetical protein